MSQARHQLVIVGLGFFALIAQTLLFRDFLAALEGNEIAVGAFFSSWLFWVGGGAIVGRQLAVRLPATVSRFLWLVLLYLPAYIIQQQVIGNGRALLGLPSFVLLPLPQLLAFAMIANAPVSLLTGLLFTLACRWAEAVSTLPVARVYILETLGGFLGGLAVTVLLATGMGGERIFLAAAWVLLLILLNAVGSTHKGLRFWGSLVLLLTVGWLAVDRLAPFWQDYRARGQWYRLMTENTSYRGSFATAQAHYLYGQREGDFIVMNEGGVIESLPEEEHASALAAWAIAQQPAAQKVLIIGSGGLAIGRRLHVLPQIKEVVWLTPDPEFSQRVLAVLPVALRKTYERVRTPGQDIRHFLAASQNRFDLILVNVAEPTSLVLNRYFTAGFFALLADSLVPGGVGGIKLAGASNYLGDERMLAGASAFSSFGKVFPHLAIKPGDETFLFGAREPVLSNSAAVLAERFRTIGGAGELYPVEGLLAAYPRDRIDFQLRSYQRAQEQYGETLLTNSDMQPKALLFELLLTLRRGGSGRIVPVMLFLVTSGLSLGLLALGLFGVLRIVHRWRSRCTRMVAGDGRLPAAEGELVLAVAGLAGMALTVVMMFCYQMRFGSLFLDVGLISSLFMLGSAAGGMVSERLVQRPGARQGRLLLAMTGLQAGLLLGLPFVLETASVRWGYALLFPVAGFFSGLYFPLAAKSQQLAGREPEQAAGRLELLDHLGGALGAIGTGLLLLPLLGVASTLLMLAAMVTLVNVTAMAATGEPETGKGRDWFDRWQRPCGYVLFGVGAITMVAFNSYQWSQADREESDFVAAAMELAGGQGLGERRATAPDGTTYRFFTVQDGYIFPSRPLAPGIRGYGGEIGLAIRIDSEGKLVGFRLLRSRETPAYVHFLHGWLAGLVPRALFVSLPFAEVQAVSGATMSSSAILRSLEMAAHNFGITVLGRPLAAPANAAGRPGTLWQVMLLSAMVVIVLVARRYPHRRRRLMLLGVCMVLFGPLLNLQYASQQVMVLLSGNFSLAPFDTGFFLVVVIPVLVMLFGNIYCGYLCPFGALQELLGDLRPVGLVDEPAKDIWRYGRQVKYLLLFLLVCCYAMTGDYGTLQADPLITIFGTMHDPLISGLVAWLLVLSLLFRRFWCRNLCPAGAFLALLGGLRLLRRFLPVTRPGRCDLGVQDANELDCLQCDRCRHEKN